jgi:hypothetical protein
MLSGILIIAVSLVLLVYWFRYSCILILRNQQEQKQRAAVPAGRFALSEMQERLRVERELDPLHQLLDRDYKILKYLLEHAAGLELDSLEDRVLVLDYRVMQWVYRLTRIAAPEQARRALLEMASVLGALDRRIVQRAGVQSES